MCCPCRVLFFYPPPLYTSKTFWVRTQSDVPSCGVALLHSRLLLPGLLKARLSAISTSHLLIGSSDPSSAPILHFISIALSLFLKLLRQQSAGEANLISSHVSPKGWQMTQLTRNKAQHLPPPHSMKVCLKLRRRQVRCIFRQMKTKAYLLIISPHRSWCAVGNCKKDKKNVWCCLDTPPAGLSHWATGYGNYFLIT